MAGKLKSILRERVWWPGITADAEEWVKSCQTCATNGRPERPTPMKRSLVPGVAWESIAIDFNGPYAKLGGISILVVIDYRSRYLIARPVKSTSFECTRKVLDDIFEREGFPKSIRSDNGPPFNGAEYGKYCAERGIETIFSTPLFPQQNGLVENSMKIVNKATSTAISEKTNYIEELRSAVNAHNAAAHSVTGVPPEEVMMGRKIKRRLPLLSHAKAKHSESDIDTRDKRAKLASKVKEDARRGARPCRIGPGDTVIVERNVRQKGDTRFDPTRYTVLEERDGNLMLTNDSGNILKRHVSQTKKVFGWRTSAECEAQLNLRPDRARNSSGGNRNSTDEERDPELEPVRRSTREKKKPSYLDQFVRRVDRV